MPPRQTHVLEWLKDRAAADPPMQAAARARDAAPGEPDQDETSILSVLTRQHDQVTALLQQVKAIPGVTRGGSPSRQAERASIIGMITVALSKHEGAEEEHFWPWVSRVLEDGDELAQAARGQEQEGKKLLAALGKTEASQERFDELAEELDKACRKHVAFEDRVLLRLRTAASPQDCEAAGARFLRAWRHAPTRPCPRVPDQPKGAAQPVKRRGRASPAAQAADRKAGDESKD